MRRIKLWFSNATILSKKCTSNKLLAILPFDDNSSIYDLKCAIIEKYISKSCHGNIGLYIAGFLLCDFEKIGTVGITLEDTIEVKLLNDNDAQGEMSTPGQIQLLAKQLDQTTKKRKFEEDVARESHKGKAKLGRTSEKAVKEIKQLVTSSKSTKIALEHESSKKSKKSKASKEETAVSSTSSSKKKHASSSKGIIREKLLSQVKCASTYTSNSDSTSCRKPSPQPITPVVHVVAHFVVPFPQSGTYLQNPSLS